MVVSYLGALIHPCDMCKSFPNRHAYEYDLLLKNLYPKDYKTRLVICEKCAKREVGNKHWDSVKRSKTGV